MTAMQGKIERALTTKQGTLGTLFIEQNPFCFTLELPWRNNEVNASCIPVGKYLAKFEYSHRFERCVYTLQNVPNRSAIEIHSGNWAGSVYDGLKTDTQGCILLGNYFELNPHEQIMIKESRNALRAFEAYLAGVDIELNIFWKDFRRA